MGPHCRSMEPGPPGGVSAPSTAGTMVALLQAGVETPAFRMFIAEAPAPLAHTASPVHFKRRPQLGVTGASAAQNDTPA
jgi:hypothetical protein